MNAKMLLPAILFAIPTLSFAAPSVQCRGELDDEGKTEVQIVSVKRDGQERISIEALSAPANGAEEFETMLLSIDRRVRNRLGTTVYTGTVLEPKRYEGLLTYTLKVPRLKQNSGSLQFIEASTGEAVAEAPWELKCK